MLAYDWLINNLHFLIVSVPSSCMWALGGYDIFILRIFLNTLVINFLQHLSSFDPLVSSSDFSYSLRRVQNFCSSKVTSEFDVEEYEVVVVPFTSCLTLMRWPVFHKYWVVSILVWVLYLLVCFIPF